MGNTRRDDVVSDGAKIVSSDAGIGTPADGAADMTAWDRQVNQNFVPDGAASSTDIYAPGAGAMSSDAVYGEAMDNTYGSSYGYYAGSYNVSNGYGYYNGVSTASAQGSMYYGNG